MGAITAIASVRLAEFSPQNLANTAWAFAKLVVREEETSGAIAVREVAKLEE